MPGYGAGAEPCRGKAGAVWAGAGSEGRSRQAGAGSEGPREPGGCRPAAVRGAGIPQPKGPCPNLRVGQAPPRREQPFPAPQAGQGRAAPGPRAALCETASDPRQSGFKSVCISKPAHLLRNLKIWLFRTRFTFIYFVACKYKSLKSEL